MARPSDSPGDLLTYDMPLRPDLVVTLTLPKRLTVEDGNRLCAFIGSLVFEEEPQDA